MPVDGIRFWDMHDLLFGMEPPLSRSATMEAARGLSPDIDDLETCVADEADGVVDRDLNDAAVRRLTGTPTFFIGVREKDGTVKTVSRISGLRPVATFVTGIEEALKR